MHSGYSFVNCNANMKKIISGPQSVAILAGIFSFFKGITLSLFARLIISGIALIVIFRDARATSDLSESQVQQLKSGAVLVAVQQADEPSKGMVEASILIDAPAENIWQIMVNCNEIPTFVPGLKACRVLAAGETWEIICHGV